MKGPRSFINAIRQREEFKDLGFGTSFNSKNKRLINPDGSFNVRRKGGGLGAINPYQWLLELTWWQFSVVVTLSFVVLNSFFGVLYLAIGIDQLQGPLPAEITGWPWLNDFAQAFFFSAQTFTTVGFGSINPVGYGAHLLSSFEAMCGWLGFAVATGVLYGRFSRPSAKIRFSKNAIIAPYLDGNSLQFRIANRRKNQLIELQVTVVLMWYEPTKDGEKQRFFSLDLERDRVTLFPLNWTIVHPIGPESPLKNATPEILEERRAEILVTIKAWDDTFAQQVHVRSSYKYRDLLWSVRFEKMFDSDEDGDIVLDLNKIDNTYESRLNAPAS